MTKGLFHYPTMAAFGRALPKSKVFAFGKVGRRVRDIFAQEIDQIVWSYKLAPETINIPAGGPVSEIQVFTLELKAGVENGSLAVLASIDHAIPHPIIFEVLSATSGVQRLKVLAAYKRPSATDSSKWVLGQYFSTDWMPIDTKRSPLPVALSLVALYEQLICDLMPLQFRVGETIEELAERCDSVACKGKELAKLEALMNRETQFNRKVEINARLRAVKAELDSLSGTRIV